jgi:tRNA pseudouridine38-40 synthase
VSAPARFGVLLTIAYDGRALSGYARQTNARTVAGELEGAVRAIDERASEVRGASRTDAGVHARRQVVAFDTDKPIDSRSWVLALSQHLSDEISPVRAARVEPGFDPRAHALWKTYRYVLLRSRVRDPFWEGRAWRLKDRLNQQSMQAEAQALVGDHDFAAFRSSADLRPNTRRRIISAELRVGVGDHRCLELEVTGNGFLHRMMRIVAGTLVDVGRGRLAAGAIQRALESGARSDLGMTAPPDGLYLEHVELDDFGRDPWPTPEPD